MNDNQKSRRIYKFLIILVVVGTTLMASWFVSRPKSNNNSPLNVCSTNIKDTTNESSQLPLNWVWYEIKDIGLKYAYPKDWTSPTTLTNSGSQKYEASFTVSSSGANTIVSLSPGCSDFQTTLSDINNGKFDTLEDNTTTKAIKHSQSSYSALTHWSGDSGHQYKLITYNVVSVESIRSVTVTYSVVAGSESCPDDKVATSDQSKCITQSISDEVDKIIGSLQKI